MDEPHLGAEPRGAEQVYFPSVQLPKQFSIFYLSIINIKLISTCRQLPMGLF